MCPGDILLKVQTHTDMDKKLIALNLSVHGKNDPIKICSRRTREIIVLTFITCFNEKQNTTSNGTRAQNPKRKCKTIKYNTLTCRVHTFFYTP